MEYKPITAVWEITMGCNMRCKHCGSSCENALPGELTTDEAVRLCEDLGKLGFQWITLSGGEPTTRKDWDIIAKALNDNGVIPNVITNGWLLNEEIIERAEKAGVNTMAISLDGLKSTHDYIRKEGSYDRIMKAFELFRNSNINLSVITTINNVNIKELKELKDILIDKGVKGWQLQIGLPMGNMAKNAELIATPEHLDEIIDFALETNREGKIDVQLADCIGYFNKKEIEARNISSGTEGYYWQGCGAGKFSMGILHDGDILGCTSVRDKSFVEGNVKITPVIDIWNNPESFSWNRNMSKDKLSGLCKICSYGNRCLGGCANTRLTIEGTVYAENRYCSYNVSMKTVQDQFEHIEDLEVLTSKAKKFVENNSFQLAGFLLEKAIEKDSSDLELQSLYGYVSFMLGNYQQAKTANERVLAVKPENAYALKGMGLSVSRLGNVEEGIEYLRKAIELSDKTFMDPYYDLAIVYYESGRNKEALEILDKGRSKSPEFIEMSNDLYDMLCNVG
ncbi:MAG: radical SAM protein [Clostridiaceae bacterium]|nr:radical SAM protein [Clostridiaceae bacterium]